MEALLTLFLGGLMYVDGSHHPPTPSVPDTVLRYAGGVVGATSVLFIIPPARNALVKFMPLGWIAGLLLVVSLMVIMSAIRSEKCLQYRIGIFLNSFLGVVLGSALTSWITMIVWAALTPSG